MIAAQFAALRRRGKATMFTRLPGFNGAAEDAGRDRENGHRPREIVDEPALIEALEREYDFPAYYPVVVIARQGTGFQDRLLAEVERAQGDAPYRIRERTSRQETYISYRVELFVNDAHTALRRKETLGAIEGVLYLL
jgi:hypothetical protein